MADGDSCQFSFSLDVRIMHGLICAKRWDDIPLQSSIGRFYSVCPQQRRDDQVQTSSVNGVLP